MSKSRLLGKATYYNSVFFLKAKKTGFTANCEFVMGEEHRNSLAAPSIFCIVIVFHSLSRCLELLKKRRSRNDWEMQLTGEIKQLLKEASSLSGPSTFAQAAKLRRSAAAKEKELARYRELRSKEMKLSYDLYLKVLSTLKVVTYLVLICWFWREPVAAVSQQLVQPFGKVLSWWGGGILNGNVMVGIVPWLILSTRVSKFVCRLLQ
ncbi:hypothetical protein HS088_TW01G01021 [Tripterygium wilfordii]|uniref:Tail-anchored protein insertion receptor WRB n=1 Tax=Tripterygium wilfordii TaxID=458696 RepID=A0A7J7E361_TRIWF|nr:uncharacterized protein LOC119999075 [Tripterygium wilfordii]KAF5753102.1 hypothetical protein HS088_TW01G01021 [Tripterygium wilfordii]